VTTIHTHLDPVYLDQIVDFHNVYVAQAYGLGKDFETYIRKGLIDFLERHDAKKECFWLAKSEGKFVGTIAVANEAGVARVRWLLTHPDHHESGLESELLTQAIAFCKGKYTKVYLLAATLFERLAPLAKAADFQKIEERTVVLWNQIVTDERYELELPT
jgi:N-acetylglutamate synthase-like GNAT family acetyltransferase